MLRLSLHPVDLPLRHAWTIAHGTRTVQHNLIVALHDPDTGHTGYGEAPGIPYMGVTVEAMVDWLTPVSEMIRVSAAGEALMEWDVGAERFGGMVGDAITQLETLGAMGHSFVLEQRQRGHDPAVVFAIGALDQAMHDLWGKRRDRSTRSLWSDGGETLPRSDYTLGLAKPDVMVDKLKELPDFPFYKIKLGTSIEQGGTAHDLSIVKRLRDETDVPFRVDANAAWTAEQTIRISGPLRDLGVEFIEQPLPPPPEASRAEHEAVCFGSDLPIIADESCQTFDDIERCAGLFHGINIKLCKCGGLTPARRMIAHARQLGLRVMAGCMTETTVGISALAQLLPLLDDVDMDGALLLADGADVADGVRLRGDGVAVFPNTSGNGVTLLKPLRAVSTVA